MDESRLKELMAKLARRNGLGPFRTPEEAEAAYDAAPDEPLPDHEIRAMVERITGKKRHEDIACPKCGYSYIRRIVAAVVMLECERCGHAGYPVDFQRRQPLGNPE